MFDFGQIVEKMTGLFEQSGEAQNLLNSNMTEWLESANLDPSLLENASVDQLSELLSQAGIDPTSLADGQILETAQELLQSGGLENVDLSSITGNAENS